MKLKINLSKLKNPDLSFKSFKSPKFPKLPKKMSEFLQKIKSKHSKSASLSLSKRDFMLVGLLVLGIEGYGLYNMLLSPKWQAYSSLQTRYAAEQIIATNFEKDMAQKSQYLENLKLLVYKFNVLTQEIPTEIPQEEIVLSLNKLALASKLDISGIAFSTISTVSKQDFATGKTSSAQPQNAGKVITPTSVASDSKTSQGTTSTSTSSDSKTNQAKSKLAGNSVLVEDVDITFSGNYGALYNFVSGLEKSDRKIIVREVSMARGDGSLLKGALKVQYVGYTTPEDKSTYSLDTPAVSGKDSPFMAYPGFTDKVAATSTGSIPDSAPGPTQGLGPTPVKSYAPNFHLILNTYNDDAPKVIMGDYSGVSTELYSNANDKIKGKISISGNLDKMTYSYSVGSLTQTKDAKLTIDGGKLRLNVISQQRANPKDKAGIILDIDNRTDFPLEISVNNDDKDAPRFSIGDKSGSVVMK